MEACRPTLKILKTVSFDEETIKAISKKTRSLANPIRLKILKLLLDNKELCVCEIENALSLKQSKVSYHLGALVEGGFIDRRESGQWSFYSLNSHAPAVLNLFDLK